MSSAAFKKFASDAVSTSQREVVTAPLWSDGLSELNKISTSSNQTENQKRYYYQIFNDPNSVGGAQSQFSMAYCDSKGSGSSTGSFGYDPLDYPTKANYSQYKQLLLTNQNLFTFQNGEQSEYVYAINVDRARYKDKIDTNTWQLNLAEINGTGSAKLGQVVVSSSNKIISLIDDSGASTTELSSVGDRVYFVRSGSLDDGINTSDTTPWGLFYPDHGVIILNGKALDASASFSTARTSAGSGTEFGGGADNNFRFYTAVSGAMDLEPDSGSFVAKTSEVIAATYYYVRIFNNELNYTQNPSFYSGSQNELRWPGMYNDPRVYITTVGLYDDSFNLLGVAKLNQPIAKTFDKEITIKIKLDY